MGVTCVFVVYLRL